MTERDEIRKLREAYQDIIRQLSELEDAPASPEVDLKRQQLRDRAYGIHLDLVRLERHRKPPKA